MGSSISRHHNRESDVESAIQRQEDSISITAEIPKEVMDQQTTATKIRNLQEAIKQKTTESVLKQVEAEIVKIKQFIDSGALVAYATENPDSSYYDWCESEDQLLPQIAQRLPSYQEFRIVNRMKYVLRIYWSSSSSSSDSED